MQFVSLSDGVLHTRSAHHLGSTAAATFGPALSVLNHLLLPDGLARGAVHEVLGQARSLPWFFALLLAHTAVNSSPTHGAIIWSDPRGELYPPAAAAMLPINRLFLLRVRKAIDQLWALTQCLRCKAVAVTVATPPSLSRLDARRLQLAAERGGGIGVLIRPAAAALHYAAATRWLVQPAPGDQLVQRWSIQLIHGHGGNIDKKILLEVPRDILSPNHVRAIDPLAHRHPPAETARASA
ncbi:MAG: hypothetical protein ABR964_03835 [Tepidisphaeraceae bacterium]|jgi:hypothetical protein